MNRLLKWLGLASSSKVNVGSVKKANILPSEIKKMIEENGDVESMNRLLHFFEEYIIDKNDEESSKELLLQFSLADSGNSEAQFVLANNFENGGGIKQNFPEALKWYEKSAKKGHGEAQYILGMFYYQGNGVTQNSQTALNWFIKAAENDHSDAQAFLGIIYTSGKIPPNEQESMKWTRMSVRQGNQKAKMFLASFYQMKIANSIHEKESENWYRKIKEDGVEDEFEYFKNR